MLNERIFFRLLFLFIWFLWSFFPPIFPFSLHTLLNSRAILLVHSLFLVLTLVLLFPSVCCVAHFSIYISLSHFLCMYIFAHLHCVLMTDCWVHELISYGQENCYALIPSHIKFLWCNMFFALFHSFLWNCAARNWCTRFPEIPFYINGAKH